MKKPTIFKLLLVVLFLIQSCFVFSQNKEPFSPKFNKDLKGDMLLIGNNILNRYEKATWGSSEVAPEIPYNGNKLNSDFEMKYINIDKGIQGIYNSSSADLKVPNPNASAVACFKIVYAGLYWGAVTKGDKPIANVKFKMPTGGYNDIVGTEIYTAGSTAIGTSFPYACYADVTNLVTGAGNPNPEGTYTIANVSTKEGTNRPSGSNSGGTGLSAGWSLFVVYEDPNLPAKSITSFNGFSAISSTENLDILVSGFRTVPNGPVNAKFAFSALEGDQSIAGDYLLINNKKITPIERPRINKEDNFFNSSVTSLGSIVNTGRNPNSSNTLGFDAGIIEIDNNDKSIIKNGETKATIGLRSSQDVYFYYFNAFAVDIIEPKIILTKNVSDNFNFTTNIGGQNVTKGADLWYKIGFVNQGNDDAVDLVIKDILPDNIIFDESSLEMPAGVSYTYNAADKTLLFTVQNSLVVKANKEGIGPYFDYDIKFKVKVIEDCYALSKICNSEIKNQAFATYRGVENKNLVNTESYAQYSACDMGAPAPTNFLVGIEDCKYEQEYQFCGLSVDLKAADGYDTYVWSKTKNGPIIGTGQIFKATAAGTYYVKNTSSNTCYKPIVEEIVVKDATSVYVNPIINYADNDKTIKCENDDKFLPKIFLCGKTDSREIKTGITGATIVWETSSCVDLNLSTNCANESKDCNWTTAGVNGPNFIANKAGQFRLTVTYEGGCVARHYFNVYKNELDPKVQKQDIICNTKGQIVVTNVPVNGYLFSKDGINFQESNIFKNVAKGDYTITIRQEVEGKVCDFTVTTTILEKIFSTTVNVISPQCPGETGKIEVQAKDVRAQYQYFVYYAGTTNLVNSSALISDDRFTFDNLTPGKYDVKVITEDGCEATKTVEVLESSFKARATITKPLTACSNGEITIYPEGGTPNYIYTIVGPLETINQASPVFEVLQAGDYTITAIDKKGCKYTLETITIKGFIKPVYTISKTDNNCYGTSSAEIKFNITSANGYALRYSIDNGVTFINSATFLNVANGTYTPVLEYSINGAVCTEVGTPIVITGATSAISASAGVASLAGCSLSGAGGLLRITNVQGGAGGYEFSFDGGASWQTSKEMEVLPGTYNLAVKDKAGCVYHLPYTVKLDPKPADPVIEDTINAVYNCNGTATATVVVKNPATAGDTTYNYEYYLKTGNDAPVANTPITSNVFKDVPSGSHTVIVKYNVDTVPNYSNLLLEDFGSGPDVTSPGINAAFCWERQVEATKCNGNKLFGNGEYTVTNSLINNPYSGWHNPVDHTTGAIPGRYLAVDAGTAIPNNAVLYRKVINDIIPNQPIQVKFFATNLLKVGNTQPDASLTVELQNKAGKALSSQSTGGIPKTDGWVEYNLTINPGENTTLDFVLRLEVSKVDGIDFAVDDIEVYQIPKVCGNEKEVPIIIETGKSFKAPTPTVQNAQCNGGKGSIQITAENFDTTTGFYYSTDNGITWTTSTTSPVIITDLAAGTYDVIVKNDAAGTCNFTFESTITAPSAIIASSIIVTPPTCTNGATIKPSATGGSGVYEFELRVADGTTVIPGYEFSKKLTAFVNVPSGIYTVVAKDVNGCISPASDKVTIDAPTPPTATLDTAASQLCYDSVNKSTLVVKVTGGTAPFTYKLDTNPAQSGANGNKFTNVGPGTHTIVVTDSNNCTATIGSIIIAPQLTAAKPAVTGLLCDPATDATITIALSGGTQPYSYTVNGGAKVDLTVGTSTITYSTPTANTYNFAITDASGCSTTAKAIVNAITNPKIKATPKQVSCFGGADGEVTLVGSAGSGGYTYNFNGNGFTTTTVYKNLKAGISYPYEVKDSKGCIGSGTITLTQPSELVITASATKLTCNTSNVKQTALVTVDIPTTGTSPYQYSFNGNTPGSNTYTVTDNRTDQTINIVVTDKNGCTASTSVVVKGLNGPTDITFAANAITCTATTTTITATAKVVTGSLVLPLKYEITSPTAAVTNNTDGVFADLAAGTYNFKVTDANGCFKEKPFTIASVTPIVVTANKVRDVLCHGGNTGKATFTVSGFSATGNYDIVVTPVGTPYTVNADVIAIDNLIAGTYTVKVTDRTTGCFYEDSVTIIEPVALTLTAKGTNVNCNDFKSQITGAATGGTGLYTYAAVKKNATAPTVFAANPIIVNTNLGADLVWDVYAKDANGCVANTTITIVKDAVPTVTAVLDNQCDATANNKFTITATGTGLADLSYSIDGKSFQPTGKFDNLSPGKYTVTVKDGNGCTATATPVDILQRLTANAQTTKELDCSATSNAIITTTISGGKANYSYTVTRDGGPVSAPITGVAGPTFTTSVLVADFGVYTFNITDANGCTTTATATVLERANPTVAAKHVDVSCFGGTNGSVTLTGSNGSGGFTYSDNATTGFTNNPTFTGLAAGNYTFYVKDSKGCVGSVPLTISQPDPIIANATATSLSCSVTNTKQSATITVTPTGGTGTYTYSYDNGLNFGPSNNKVINDNGATQTFQIIVKDANGCTSAMQVVTIAPLNPPSITSIVPSVITCNAQTSSATVTILGGVGTLNYQIISPAVVDNGTNNVFTGLVENVIYTFKVTDANGCYDTETLKINPAKKVTVTKQILSNVDCFGGTTGSAKFTVGNTGGTISFKLYEAGVEITPPFTTDVTGQIITYTGLADGTYEFIVTDGGTGCDATETVTITQPVALTATVAKVNANCTVGTSKVTVTALGGTKEYRYSFVTSATIPGTYTNSNVGNLNPTTSLNWYVHIIDAKGCTLVKPITIATDPVPTVSVSAVSQCLDSGIPYVITAAVSGGVAPFKYSINNGASYQAGNTFTVTTAGDYKVKVLDANNCPAESSIQTVYPKLTLSAVLDKDITCEVGNLDAKITLTPTGGNPGAKTYEYSIDNGINWVAMASSVLNTNTIGSYIFRVTDLSTCTATTVVAINITPAVNPDITAVSATDINCSGDATAALTITIDPTKGLAPFVYTVLNTTTGTNYGTQTSGLAAGDYTITVTDAKGCTDTHQITITEPDPIVVSFTPTPLVCTGTGISQGSITINTVTGGTAPYDYFVTGINNYNKSITGQTGGSAVFEVVDFGLYQIRVVDANGCSKIISDILIAAPPTELEIQVSTSASCATGGSATVKILSAFIGTGPFHFNIYNGPGQVWNPLDPAANTANGWIDENPANSKSTIFSGLTPGKTYTFIVYDEDTKCYYFQDSKGPIPTNSSLGIDNFVPKNITCANATDGNVSFDIVNSYGYSLDVTYDIINAFTNISTGNTGNINIPANDKVTVNPAATVTDLAVGTYYVLVSELNGGNAGCGVSSANFNIKKSAVQLTVSASVSKNANCNANSGVISAIAKDGTGPYTYQILLATDPAPVAADLGWDSANTFNKDAGSYTVYAKDAYGCIAEFDITLNAYDAPTISAPAPICYDGTEFTITITGTVDPAIIGGKTFSVNGSAFKADPNFTFNAAGTYNLVIQDGNGCTATIAYEVYPQLELEVDLTKELDCTGTPSADFTLTATGGNPAGTYTYVYSNDGGISWLPTSAGNVHSTAATGTYVFRVTNDNNTVTSTDDCQATTSITLDPIPTPTIVTNSVAVLCKGESNGSVTIDVTAGVGPYEYSLDGIVFQDENEFTGLAEGNAYEVTVRDAKMCIYTAPFVISAPLALDAVANVTTVLKCDPNNDATKAIVTVDVTPGTGTEPYEYSFDGGANYSSENTFETVNSGVVTAKVKDANGCTIDVNATVIALNAPTAMDITGTPVYCLPVANQKSTVTINSVTDGIGTLTYTILPNNPAGVTQTGNVFSGLLPGTYLFQVKDANGCTYEDSYTVDPVTNITVSGQVTKDVSCLGETNGTAEFTVGNFEGTYSYTINGVAVAVNHAALTIPLTALGIGNHVIVVTDDITGCTATATVQVKQPALALEVIGSEVKAANCNYGAKVTAVASGGTVNYKYAYQLTTVVGIPADGDFYDSADAVLDYNLGTDWTVYVKDANGCVAQDDFTITIDDLPTINPSAGLYCYDGSPVNITITGTYVGSNPMFSIGNGYFASPNFTLNAPGTYKFFIKDENGCIVETSYTLNQELLLQADLTQDLTCDNDATITLLATQGTGVGTYTYEVSTDAGGTFSPITLSATNTYIITTAGDYTFRITDGQNCNSIEKTITVTPKTTPTFTTVETMVSCPGGTDGSITITAADGIAPYTYSIDGVNGGTYQTQNYFTGLAAGTYTITVKDAKGCLSLPEDVIITQPTVLDAKIDVTTPLSCGTGNAAQQAEVTVTVVPTTGTAPYQYSFDGINYSDNNVYKTFTADAVTAYVRDANGCVFTGILTLTIDALDPPVITTITGTDLWCSTGNTESTVTITTSNGVGTPAFEIISGPTINTTGATSGIFTGLDAGTYLFRVTDANGCTDEDYYTVKPLVNITASVQAIKAVECKGDANGTLEFKVANFTGTYTPTLSPATGTLTYSGDTVRITGLAAGPYTLTVTDAITGCPTTATATVTEPDLLELDLVSQVNATCKTDAQVTVSATGGTGTYLYAFKPVAQTPTATDYTQNAFAVLDKTITNWIAYVLDDNLCEAQLPITIATDPLPTGFTAAAALQCPSATGTYEINVTVGTGVGPFQYSIGSGFQTSPTFTVNNPGTYTVTVKDANECEVILPAVVTILEPLVLETNITALPSCTINNGSIEVKVSGGSGTGNYRIRLDGGAIVSAITHTFTNLTHGNHEIEVRDIVTNCNVTYTFELVKATEVTDFALTHTDVTCFGGNNGTITATIGASAPGVNDNPVYTYELTGTTIGGTAVTTAQTSPVFTNLEPGDYTVKVISGRGCEDQKDVRIEQPAVIAVPAPVVTPFGCTTGNETNFATITVAAVTGGSDNYVLYEFFKNNVSVQKSDSNVYTEANYAGGSYTVTVTDDKGCTGSTATAVVIAPYIDLEEITIAIDNPITCIGYEDITASVIATGGTPAVVDYKIVGLTDVSFVRNNTDGIFTGLTIGNYLITATNRDTGCSIQKIHYVNNPNSFSLQAVKTSDVICFGGNDGAVNLTLIDQITPPDNAGVFSYVVTGPTASTGTSANAGPLTLTGLTAGLYTVTATLTNSPFCEVSTTFTINQPSAALDLTVSATPITCSTGNNDGTISVTATGGWAGEYEYQVLKDGALFADYSTTTEYINLTADVYTINVKDSKGCVDTELVTLVIPTPIAVTAVANPTLLLCNGDMTGTVTATNVTGGQGSNYLYTLNYLSLTPVISSGPQVDPVFTGLGAGTYSITVTDGWSCAAESAPVTIAEPTAIEASLVVSRTQTCTIVTQLTLSASGGTGAYTYSDDATFATVLGTFTTSVSFDVLPGVYQYFVRDANGCVGFVSNEIKIDPLAPLVLVLDIENAKVNCKGDATGVIVATATGALGNYVYTLYDNANNAITPAPVQSTPGRFDGLVAGFYKVKVVSADCAEVWQSAEVTEPAEPLLYTAIKADVSCNGEKNGSLELTATGGTGVIKFAISPRLDQFFDSGTFDKLAPGDYQAIIQDELGCFHVHDFTIVQPEILNAIEVPGATLPEICAGDKDGQFSIEISGGTAPYSVSLGTIDGPYTQGAAGQTVFAFDQLSSGTQTVYYMDSLGCTAEFEIVLEAAAVLNPTVEVTYYCVDNASANLITVTVDASNDPADVDYDLDGSGTFQASNIFTNVAAGKHIITARHSNGCEKQTIEFAVELVEPLTLTISNGQLNQIVATATGGSGEYEYSFNFESFSSNVNYVYYKTDTYTVTVRDKNGCTATVSGQFEYVDVCIPNYFTPNGDGNQDTWGPGCSINYTDLVYTIFDRYGREIAKYRFGQKWDGTYKGAELPTGDYWYVLKLNNPKDDREFVGHFTLYR